MIPFYDWSVLNLGGFKLKTFGLLVGLGLLAIYKILIPRAKTLGIKPQGDVEGFMLWMMIGGAVFGHVIDLVVYHPDLLMARPIELVMVQNGLSSYGGLIGTVVAGRIYLAIKRQDPWPFTEAWCYAFPFGWFFARLGCAVVHDHVGKLSQSFLAVAIPGGGEIRPWIAGGGADLRFSSWR